MPGTAGAGGALAQAGPGVGVCSHRRLSCIRCLCEALPEVGQHTAMEAGIVQLHGQGVLEIDAEAHRPSRCARFLRTETAMAPTTQRRPASVHSIARLTTKGFTEVTRFS